MDANNGRVQFGVPVRSKVPRMLALGRICGTSGCATVLSIYNKSDDCSLHEHATLKRRRDRI